MQEKLWSQPVTSVVERITSKGHSMLPSSSGMKSVTQMFTDPSSSPTSTATGTDTVATEECTETVNCSVDTILESQPPNIIYGGREISKSAKTNY